MWWYFLFSGVKYSVDNLQNYYYITGRLTESVGVVCLNEPVIYECTIEGDHLKLLQEQDTELN